jgi:TonB family protein
MESPLIAYARDGNLDGWLGHQGSGSSGNSGVTNYAGRVLVHLNNAPRVRAQIRGSARVVLEINPDGTLARVDVIESTGTFELDSAAKAQVRNAAPFPPPPQGATRKLSFVYRSK